MKKALRAPEGVFRATFEDRILMSDLVFVRTWYPVAVPQYYNPVTSLLLRDKTAWTGMRTVGQIRHEMGKRPPVKANSLYRPIDREARHFNPLKVPAALQTQLPFKSKPKLREKQKGRRSLASKRAVVLEPEERRVLALMQQLATRHREKARRRRLQQEEKHKAHVAQREKEESKRVPKMRELKHKFYREIGKARQRTKRRETI